MEKEAGHARGQDAPHWWFCEVQLQLHCSGLYLVGKEQDWFPLAWREWGRVSYSKHRAQTASHRRWEYPIPPARPSFGAKDQQSPQWCCELPPPKRSYWELQIARALLYWKSEWLSSGVKVSIFVFWPHWFGSHLTAWIIQKCASAGKANYATLAFQILNWKIYIKHAEVRQHFWIFFVFVSRHGWEGRIVKWWKVSPMRPFLSNWIK